MRNPLTSPSVRDASFAVDLTAERQPKYIQCVLCAPIAPERSLRLVMACKQADVRFLHLATFGGFKAQYDAIKRKLNGHG